MIELNVLDQKYPCRTKDLLWYRETRQEVALIVDEGKTLPEIKQMSEEQNIFNAASASRANEIRTVTARRLLAVNDDYLRFFHGQDAETQKILTLVLVMLTDRTFLEFMDLVYREKLITGSMTLLDSDIVGYIHSVQEKDEKAASWTDAGIKKARDNYKAILKEAGMISDIGTERQILRPIMKAEMKDFLKGEGLEYIVKILAGERE